MAYTILSESYGRRLPKITAEADSTDDLTALGTDYAEGSTCNVGGTEYTLDKVSGWIVPGSGGGGGGASALMVEITDEYPTRTMNKTWKEINDHMAAGGIAIAHIFYYADHVTYGMITSIAEGDYLEVVVDEDGSPNRYTAESKTSYPALTYD